MFGIKQKLASLPWPQRLLFSVPLIAFCAWVSMRVTASIWIEEVADAMSEGNEVSYDASFFRLNGDFGATNVSLKHYVTEDGEGPTFIADRVVFHTPGLRWLWWGSMHEPKSMPDSFGVTMENVRDVTRTDQTPGNYTNLPYDAIGCGTNLLTIDQLQRIGLPEVRRDISLFLKRKDDTLSTLTLDMLTPGAGELTMDMDVTVARPLPWKETIVRFFAAKLQSASVTVKDEGFIAVRNAYCAKAAGVVPASFQGFHMQALSTRLAQEHISFDAQTLARYAQFAEHGGKLELTSRHPPQMQLADFLAMDRVQRLQRMPTMLSYNGGPEAPMQVDQRLAGEVDVLPAPTASAPAATPRAAPAIAVATAPDTAAVASAPANAMAEPARSLAYVDLKGREGTHVEILTSNATTRRGTLLMYSPYLSTVKLDADQGGFTLSVPEDSVLEVHALPTQALPSGVAETASATVTAGAPGS